MRIGLLNAPGRFPTVSHDVGAWWGTLGATGSHALAQVSLNYLWWNDICADAGVHLAGFQNGAAFEDHAVYRDHVAGLDASIATINAQQDEFVLSLGLGPEVRDLDYAASHDVVDFARRDSRLAQSLEASLAAVGPLDLALLRVTSPVDLLTAAAVATRLRRANPALHVSLIDHGYENFSLKPHLSTLEMTGALGEVFDTLIAEKDDIDAVVPDLVARLEAGERLRGFLRRGPPRRATPAPPTTPPAPLTPIFAPRPVTQMRLSPAGCYWGRCTYCTQNAKYAGDGAPSKADVAGAVQRMAAFNQAGCRTFILADEALSPAMLRAFSTELLAKAVEVEWTCRSKLERSFDPDLLNLCARAGCREILFGLETTSPDLLRRMDKEVAGQSLADIAAIFRDMAGAGLGIHINLINGFPGESLDEAWATVDFVVETLRDHPNATFGLNPFTVFPDTPISADPARWGLEGLLEQGDMPSAYPHRLDAATRQRTGPAIAAFEDLQISLETELGWRDFIDAPGGRSAFELYSASGHGVVFKCMGSNAVDLARKARQPAAPPRRRARRRRAFLTGATGVVGAAVLAELAADDWDVLAMVRDPTSGAALGCRTLVADLYDLPHLDDVLMGMDAVVHCASPRSTDRQTMLVGEVDATGRLLEAWSSGTFVYTSSQTVYGLPGQVLREQDPVRPDNWYDLAKIANEHQVAFTAREVGAVGVSLRLPLVLSSSVRPGSGNYLIGLFEALQRGEPFVFADVSAMENDGTVYIADRDLAAAVVLAADLHEGGVYNLAGGFVTWRRLIEALGEIAGKRPRFSLAADNSGGFELPRSRTEFDTTRFDAASGFRPASSLQQTLLRFVEAWRTGRIASTRGPVGLVSPP